MRSGWKFERIPNSTSWERVPCRFTIGRRSKRGLSMPSSSRGFTRLMGVLNGGLLPDGYYGLAEQHLGGRIPVVLTLIFPARSNSGSRFARSRPNDRFGRCSSSGRSHTGCGWLGGLSRPATNPDDSAHKWPSRCCFAGDRLSRRQGLVANVAELVAKVDSALMRGIHVLLVDLFSPGKHDPQGIHGAIWERFGSATHEVPSEQSLAVASYAGAQPIEAYVEHFAVGDRLPEMPLFLNSVTLYPSPARADLLFRFSAMPQFWRDVLEGRRTSDSRVV